MRTKEEIQATIAKLQEMKPNVRRTTFFGDNNHAAIDAQIWVLENEASEDEVYDEFDTDHERDNALEAAAWLEGEELDGGGLVEGWQSLVNE